MASILAPTLRTGESNQEAVGNTQHPIGAHSMGVTLILLGAFVAMAARVSRAFQAVQPVVGKCFSFLVEPQKFAP